VSKRPYRKTTPYELNSNIHKGLQFIHPSSVFVLQQIQQFTYSIRTFFHKQSASLRVNVTNSMARSPSLPAGSYSAGQEITNLLRHQKVFYRVHKSPSLDPNRVICLQLTPQTQFYICIPFKPRSPKWYP
jgi:hypothetical protein